MPRSSYEEIEVVDIDDPPPVTDLTDETKKKERRVRKSTGLGGKTRRVAITSRPVRRPPPPSLSPASKTMETRRKKTIECFDIDDGDEDDDESAAGQDSDSDDDIEVLENEDPLEDGESIEEDQTGGFCDLCGLHLASKSEIENHLRDVHKLTSCEWCQTRTRNSELKKHILTSCAKFVKLRGTHCSIHKRIETEEDLNHQQYTNCRPLSCDTCEQRFEITSLLQKEVGKELFICPGCLHGRIDPTKIINTEITEASHSEEEANNDITDITEDSEGTEITEITEDSEITEITEDSEITEITEITEDSEITEITEESEITEIIGDKEITEITEDHSSKELTETKEGKVIREDKEGRVASVARCEEDNLAPELVTEILADLLTSSLLLTEQSEVHSRSSHLSVSGDCLPILDVSAGVGAGVSAEVGTRIEHKTEGSVIGCLAVVEKAESARRVARKSSRPPLNPQRPSTGPGVCQEERLLVETSEPPTSKRKPEQGDLINKPVRKVARKSTKPPANPQKEKEPEIVEIEEEDEDIVEIPGVFTTSHLLQSPPQGQGGLQAFQELEEMVLG